MKDEQMLALGKVIAELILRIVRNTGAEILKTQSYTSSADSVLVLCGLWVGQADGRPMTVAKLAQYIGMPRGTVARKVDELVARGLVKKLGRGNVVDISDEVLHAVICRNIDSDVRHIHAASRKLSKLDNH